MRAQYAAREHLGLEELRDLILEILKQSRCNMYGPIFTEPSRVCYFHWNIEITHWKLKH